MVYERIASDHLRRMVEFFPAVAVTGPRQSGKTTLLKQLFPDWHYVSFDTAAARRLFEDDPSGFLAAQGDRVILDEVQKVPALFENLKQAIDADRTPGRFLLTGSAQFSMVRGIGETLAGRCGFQALLPFQYAEIGAKSLEAAELGGFYPELVVRQWQLGREWYDAYVTTYLERDVRTLLDVGNLRDFRTVLGLLAARTGQELNLSSVAREAGVTEKTVASWVSVLEASYLIFLLKPWHKNLGKRLVKRPKLYFWDPGLVCFLCGIRTQEQLAQGPLAGALFENLVVADTAKDLAHRGLDRSLWYFRTNAGLEVDLIVEDPATRSRSLVEVKRRTTVKPEDTKTIRTLLAHPDLGTDGWTTRGLVVRQGQGRQPLSPDIDEAGAPTLLGSPW